MTLYTSLFVMTMLGVSFYSAFFELGTFVDPATSALAKSCSATANGENDPGPRENSKHLCGPCFARGRIPPDCRKQSQQKL